MVVWAPISRSVVQFQLLFPTWYEVRVQLRSSVWTFAFLTEAPHEKSVECASHAPCSSVCRSRDTEADRASARRCACAGRAVWCKCPRVARRQLTGHTLVLTRVCGSPSSLRWGRGARITGGFGRPWGLTRERGATSGCPCRALGRHGLRPPGGPEDRRGVPEAVRPGAAGPAAAVAVERARDGSGRPHAGTPLGTPGAGRAPSPHLPSERLGARGYSFCINFGFWIKNK